jgi:hypothetical protein
MTDSEVNFNSSYTILKMLLPKLNNAVLSFYTTILSLMIESKNGGLYMRKYYLAEYTDSSRIVFLTTDEYDSSCQERYLDVDFMIIPDITTLINELEKSCLVEILTGCKFNAPPKYIHYNIVFMEDYLKPHFKKHLLNSIEGFTNEDFDTDEKSQIKKWLQQLKK